VATLGFKGQTIQVNINETFYAGMTDIEVICCFILPHMFTFYFYQWQQLKMTLKFFRLPDAQNNRYTVQNN
jgi:hypothetical protein